MKIRIAQTYDVDVDMVTEPLRLLVPKAQASRFIRREFTFLMNEMVEMWGVVDVRSPTPDWLRSELVKEGLAKWKEPR